MRQRHFTDFVKNIVKIALIRKFGNSVSVFKDFLYLRFQDTLTEGKFSSLSRFLAGACHNLPGV